MTFIIFLLLCGAGLFLLVKGSDAVDWFFNTVHRRKK
jgi:hypothetical protein